MQYARRTHSYNSRLALSHARSLSLSRALALALVFSLSRSLCTAAGGGKQVVQFLLEAGADKKIPDNDGVTPADRAMANKPPWPLTASAIQVFKFPERPPGELVDFWLQMDENLRLGVRYNQTFKILVKGVGKGVGWVHL